MKNFLKYRNLIYLLKTAKIPYKQTLGWCQIWLVDWVHQKGWYGVRFKFYDTILAMQFKLKFFKVDLNFKLYL